MSRPERLPAFALLPLGLSGRALAERPVVDSAFPWGERDSVECIESAEPGSCPSALEAWEELSGLDFEEDCVARDLRGEGSWDPVEELCCFTVELQCPNESSGWSSGGCGGG